MTKARPTHRERARNTASDSGKNITPCLARTHPTIGRIRPCLVGHSNYIFIPTGITYGNPAGKISDTHFPKESPTANLTLSHPPPLKGECTNASLAQDKVLCNPSPICIALGSQREELMMIRQKRRPFLEKM